MYLPGYNEYTRINLNDIKRNNEIQSFFDL